MSDVTTAPHNAAPQAFVRTKATPDLPPPRAIGGALGWMRENMFSNALTYNPRDSVVWQYSATLAAQAGRIMQAAA